MEHYACRPKQWGWCQIRSVLHLAQYTLVHLMLQGKEMSVVVNVVGAVLTIEYRVSFLHFTMVVKCYGYH